MVQRVSGSDVHHLQLESIGCPDQHNSDRPWRRLIHDARKLENEAAVSSATCWIFFFISGSI
jgi:hypothetical protein